MAFLCGCDPRHGFICSTHCQWQGCTDDHHTEACIRGERVNKPARIARQRDEES